MQCPCRFNSQWGSSGFSGLRWPSTSPPFQHRCDGRKWTRATASPLTERWQGTQLDGGPNGDGVRHPWISGISYLFGANRNADYCWFNWGNGNVMDLWLLLIVYHPAWGFISPFEALKQQMSTIQTGLGTQRFWWYLSESNLWYHLVMTNIATENHHAINR